MTQKKRLDAALQEQYPQYSRTQLNSWIVQGKVTVDGKPMTKAGVAVKPTAEIILTHEEPRYVCRAGFKLEKALEYFNIDVNGLVILDAGLSTGGFSDCLLQKGAARVYGVDVGHGQVHEKIRQHPNVIVMEKTNLRHLESLPEQVDLATLDLSFISLLKVIPVVKQLLKPNGQLITLIKPQFEAEKHEVGRKGIITDPLLHKKIVDKVIAGIIEAGFTFHGVIESPIKGTQGNTEFLAYFTRA
ncbi:MAG: TlyA family RNA methyltransferase [Candidatus Babeliaceae bacterium]|jgi:23S rRNA (cytidine1920-2'-O)/16S rRNA (cytidine1409-2'-O)-methyltransferase